MLCILVWGSCMTCFNVCVCVCVCVCSQFRIAATRPRTVKLCCIVWHGIVTVLKTGRGMRHAAAVTDTIGNCRMCWYSMKLSYVLIQYEIVVCVDTVWNCRMCWYNMKLLYVSVGICVHLYICRLRRPVRWDPSEMLLKLRHIKLQQTEMCQCRWEHREVLKECQ